MFDDADWADTTNATVRVLTGGMYVRDVAPGLALAGGGGSKGRFLGGSRSDSSSTRDKGGRVEESGVVPKGGGGSFEGLPPVPGKFRCGGCGRRLERASLSVE